MYRIAIFKLRSEPESIGYQTNYRAVTGAGTGLEKNGRISGQPEPDIRYIPSFNTSDIIMSALLVVLFRRYLSGMVTDQYRSRLRMKRFRMEAVLAV